MISGAASLGLSVTSSRPGAALFNALADEGAILEFGRIELTRFLQLDMKWNGETCIDKAKITPNAQDVKKSKPRH